MRKSLISMVCVMMIWSIALPAFAANINLSGDFNFRYRENKSSKAGEPGFQQYEVEFFADSTLNKNVSVFLELPFYHSNRIDLGNSWADFHFADEIAATDNTGLMIGQIAPWFGYFGYDDNQSWIYGGRTTTNTALVRGSGIDGLVIRDRAVGIAANLKLGPVLLTPQVYNGAGYWRVAGGTDNDQRKDFVGRVQYTLPDELGQVGAGYWNSPRTAGATANSGGTAYGSGGIKHARDVVRYAAFFKYPNVMQATLPDLSLGGKPFVVYGEYVWGKHEGNPEAVAALTTDQKFLGWWIETNVSIIGSKLVGVLRYDYYDANTDTADNQLIGITPALKWEMFPMVFTTVSYEVYTGGEKAGSKLEDDRAVVELSLQF